MALSRRPVLTIAIPTYNREKFLDRALSYLLVQLVGADLPVEIIVSDNCSYDSTESVVKSYIAQGLKLRYIKNPINQGADMNVAQCYREASGQYVLVLGDDDFLIEGSLKFLVSFLEKRSYGIVFLNWAKSTDEKVYVIPDKVDFKEYSSPVEFVKKVNYYLTFISANIVNTDFLNLNTLEKDIGSSVNHFNQILECLLAWSHFAFISDVLLIVEPENAGGYNLFKVFGSNLNAILNQYTNDLRVVKIQVIINNKLTSTFLPFQIIQFRNNKRQNFEKPDFHNDLHLVFKKYLNYWLFCYPVLRWNVKVAKVYFILTSRMLKYLHSA